MQVSDSGYLPIFNMEMTDKEQVLSRNPISPPVLHRQNTISPALRYREDSSLSVEPAKPRESSASHDRWNGEHDTSTLENQRVLLGEGQGKGALRTDRVLGMNS